MSQVTIRPLSGGSDFAFIYATWRNALWFAEKRDPKLADEFFRSASHLITAKTKDADIRIACLSDDSDMLLGWALLIGDNLEFVYVKADYRRSGIGKLLTRGVKTFSPPETRIGRKLIKKYQEKPDGREEEAHKEDPGTSREPEA